MAEAKKALEWFSLARALLLSRHWRYGRPYLAKGVYALIPVVRPGLGTMAVDRWGRVYVDPSLPEKWSLEEGATVIRHEWEHLFRLHFLRGENKHGRRWNKATDLEINDDLQGEGMPLPEGVLLPEAMGFPKGLTAEEYYLLLEEKGEGEDTDPGPNPDPLGGNDGSGATGKRATWEEPPPGEKGAGEEAPGLSRAEIESLARAVAQDILDAQKAMGNVPGGLVRLAKALRERVNWRNALRAALRQGLARGAGQDDYSATRRSRIAPPGVILPGMAKKVTRVAMIVDTSGSMSNRLLGQALAEIGGVLKTLGEPVTVIATDAVAYSPQEITSLDKIQLQGGGGTDMGEGIAKALSLRPRPDLIVVLTDGITPWPNTPPPVPTLTVLLGSEGQAPSWGRAIRVEE